MLLRRSPLSQLPTRPWRCHCRCRLPSPRAAAGFSTAPPSDQPEDASSSSAARSQPSTLYERLFSQSSPPRSSSHSARSRRPSLIKNGDKDVSPSPDGDFFQWLEANSSTSSLSSTRNTSRNHQDPGAVLVLKNMPRTLLESDFYRLAAGGQHVAGWARGLVKVVQSISPMTREPRGQYYLFFDSKDSANSYLSKLNCLATVAGAKTDLGLGLPPDMPPDATILTTPALNAHIHSVSASENETTTTTPGAPASPLTTSTAVPYLLGSELAGTTVGARNTLVTVRLVGSKITVDAMSRAIAADGAARNLPWRLAEERPDDPRWPRQVQTLRAGSGKIENADSTRFAYGYTRFVLAFADAAEARRFARAWHKREMLDERTGRSMVVNAQALW